MIRLLFILLLTFSLLVIAARAMGRAMPPSPELAEFEALQCAPQPCWYGIRPGVTMLEEAKRILHNNPDFRVATEIAGNICGKIGHQDKRDVCVFSTGGVVSSIAYIASISRYQDSVRVGNAMAFFLDTNDRSYGVNCVDYGRPVIVFNHVEIFLDVENYNQDFLRPQMMIEAVEYTADNTDSFANTVPWRGFVSPKRYGEGCR